VKILNVTLLAGLLALAAAAPLGAQDIKIKLDPSTPPAAPAAPTAAPAAPAAAAQFTNEQKFETWGWLLASQLRLADLEVSPAELTSMARGMALAIQGREPAFDMQAIGPQMDELLRGRMEVAQKRMQQAIAVESEKNRKEADAFLATLKGKPGVVELPSGLRYELLAPGKGPKAKTTQMVKANYRGTLINGQEFDSSAKQGKPADFDLSKGLIPGFLEGLQLVPAGGKIKLYIPANLAYGDQGPLPPGALLIFEVEVLEIKDAPKEPAAPAAK
jgi:FKBP-type peptidyl-prolyl cis-trans isomerase